MRPGNFFHLRPISRYDTLVIDNGLPIEDYCFNWDEKKSKCSRKIYHNVPYDAYEEEKIVELEAAIRDAGINLDSTWDKIDTLKMLHNGKFDMKSSLKVTLIFIETGSWDSQ